MKILIAAILLLSTAQGAFCKGTYKGPNIGEEAAFVYKRGWENAFDLKSESAIPNLKRLPRLDGSTTAIPLAQLIVARALNLDGELRRVAQRRSGANAETLEITFARETSREKLDEFGDMWWHNTPKSTHAAYDSLIKQNSSLIIVARQPSPDELTAAARYKIEFDIQPVALDAFVFVANSKNEITGLSLNQIRDIYSGKVKNWKDIGGKDEEVFAITRDANSGSQELMKKLIMGDSKIVSGYNRMASTMGGTFDHVAANDNSIAYSVFYYERIMNPRASIKPLAINGVLPTSQTIADKTYPLVEPVYVVTRKDIAPDGPAATLRDWLLSNDGQKLIAQSGYVPINVR